MRHAFSLVELSIVLVILGLLTGGILAGQSLIRAAEIRNASTDYQRFAAAAFTFQDKYFALPGDMTNATKFWGIADGTTGNDDTCRVKVSTDARTCDGDGDGQVSGTAGGTTANYNERFRFWQHLANAGLIEGSYTGAWSSPTVSYKAGENVPASKAASSAFWYASYQIKNAGSATNFAAPGGNIIRITGNAFTNEECWNIDTKVDDGLPGTGKMMAYKGDATYPVTTAANVPPPGDANATYNFANTSRICNPWLFAF